MKKTMIALLLALAMLISVLPMGMAEEAEREHVTLNVSGVLQTNWNDYPENSQAKFLKEKFNVTLNVIDFSERKEAMMASGDLPDMFLIEAYEMAPLMESQFVLPLDDLLKEYGKDIIPDVEGMWDYLKVAMGDGEHIYAITGFGLPAGALDLSGNFFEQNWGLNVAWDRYKELGCPEVDNSIDSLYNLMVDMVNLKPTTDDGLPVYAIAYPTIEMRGRGLYAGQLFAEYSPVNFVGINLKTGELNRLYTDPESSIWQHEYLYWKLNQAGLLDPDSFLMDFDADSLKAVNGQYVATFYHDITGNATRTAAAEGRIDGFQYIPVKDSSIWAGSDGLYGGRNARLISAKCEHPERMMEVINWVYSPDGARATTSGFEGETWNYVDGVPTLTAEAKEAYEQMNDFYFESGMAFGWNGGRGEKNPDGYSPNLFDEYEYKKESMSAQAKDVEAYYGKHMGLVVQDKVAEGYMCTQAILDWTVINQCATLPDDMQRILNEVDAVMNEGMVACVLAPDEATFYASRDALIEQVKAMGITQVEDWFINSYNELMAAK